MVNTADKHVEALFWGYKENIGHTCWLIEKKSLEVNEEYIFCCRVLGSVEPSQTTNIGHFVEIVNS